MSAPVCLDLWMLMAVVYCKQKFPIQVSAVHFTSTCIPSSPSLYSLSLGKCITAVFSQTDSWHQAHSLLI